MKARYALIAAVVCTVTTAMAAPTATDTDFVTKAAQAGMAEVAAGHMAETAGQSASVKEFGKRMVADHTKAGADLQKIASREGLALPASPSSEQTAAAQKLQSLKGADFDNAYAKQMVADHNDAVALFRGEASSGGDAQLKSFAKTTLPTLEEHLKMAQALPAGGMSRSP